jgi:transglutaminase-like putative cysteine protease
MTEMTQVRVGCEFHYVSQAAVNSVFQVEPTLDGRHLVLEQTMTTNPAGWRTAYRDRFGNTCSRLTIPSGPFALRFDALVQVPAMIDDIDPEAPETPTTALPDEVITFLMPSRYCVSDVLSAQAWGLFGSLPPGWRRVQAITEMVHDHLTFDYLSASPTATAADAFGTGRGVCRDFAHVAISFCRALHIPARYVFGYLPDIGVRPPDEPMDFCAWYEVYLGGRWWTFDPRNNQHRIGRVVIGRGRDAVDVAMVTSFGSPVLEKMTVWADEVPI